MRIKVSAGLRAEQWPKKVEKMGGLVAAMDDALSRAELPYKVKFTVADGANIRPNDVLIFPDMVRFANVDTSSIQRIVSEHLEKNQVRVRDVWLDASSLLTGSDARGH